MQHEELKNNNNFRDQNSGWKRPLECTVVCSPVMHLQWKKAGKERKGHSPLRTWPHNMHFRSEKETRDPFLKVHNYWHFICRNQNWISDVSLTHMNTRKKTKCMLNNYFPRFFSSCSCQVLHEMFTLSIYKRILKYFYDFSNRFLPSVHAILFLKSRF